MTRSRIAFLLIAWLVPLLATAGDINQDFFEAVLRGDTAAVQALLAKGADVNAKDEKGGTALMVAGQNGHAASVEALAQVGILDDRDLRTLEAFHRPTVRTPDGREAATALPRFELAPLAELT